MKLITISLFVGPLLFILYKIVISKLTKRRNLATAQRLGCAPPPTLHSTNLLGTSVVKESIKANKDDRAPLFVVEAMDSLGKDVHTLRVPVFDHELLVTRDPVNAHHLLQTQSADFDISDTRANAFMPMIGKGLFTARGQQWKHSRALVKSQFSTELLADFDMLERHSQALQKKIIVSSDGWTSKMDLLPLFYNFALDTASEALWGRSVNSQSSGSGEGLEFGHNMDSAKGMVEKRGAMGKFYWLADSLKFRSQCSSIQRYVDKIVADYLCSSEKDWHLMPEKKVEEKYVLLHELGKQTRDPLELRNETLHVMTAGRDTASSLCGWVIYFLARSPEKYAKLRDEVINALGTSPFTFEQMQACQYLRHCVVEALRTASVVPMNERKALRDTTLPRGGGEDGTHPIFVAAGTQVLIPNYAIQHRKDLWGEDADEYRPERWQEKKLGWDFVPFGAGPRQCLGQHFAKTEISYLVARLVQRFDKLENLDFEPVRYHCSIENRSGTGVQVRLHEAEATK